MKKAIYIFLLSFVLTASSIVLGAIGHSWKFIGGFILGMSLFLYALKVWETNRLIMLAVTLPVIGHLVLILVLTKFKIMHFTFPSTMSYFIGILCAWFFYESKRHKIIISSFTLLFLVWVKLDGYQIWMNKMRTDTFFGYVDKPVSFKRVSSGCEIDFCLNDSTYYLVDFWSNYCGYCMKEFPSFNSIKAIDNMEPIAVNHAIDSLEQVKATDLFVEYNMKIPLLFYIGNREELLQDFGFNLFPNYVIIKNNRIIHWGDLNSVKRRVFIMRLKEMWN